MPDSIESIKARVAEMGSTRDKVIFLVNHGFDNDQIATALGSTKESVSSIKSKNKDLITARSEGGGNLDSLGVQYIDEDKDVELNIEVIDEMVFPDFSKHVTNTVFDKLWSDHDEEGGMFSGTVTICTGESGVGKSTLLIDYLAKIKSASVEGGEIVEPLYISTEMTRNDIFFYKQKMPTIGTVSTLLANDYIKGGGLWTAISKAFLETDHKIILLDSYQDLVEKFKDVCGWNATKAETKLVNLMVEAAETRGMAVIAIQHLTKGGDYVGKTFLKHATTAMLEIRFDKDKHRYVMFSKNRRGGGMTHIPLYFNLKEGEIEYDEARFDLLMNAEMHAKTEEERKEELEARFEDVFNSLSTEPATDEEEGLGETSEEIRVDEDSDEV